MGRARWAQVPPEGRCQLMAVAPEGAAVVQAAMALRENSRCRGPRPATAAGEIVLVLKKPQKGA
jgi:hypothetical protein